jgi:hypothetical protein
MLLQNLPSKSEKEISQACLFLLLDKRSRKFRFLFVRNRKSSDQKQNCRLTQGFAVVAARVKSHFWIREISIPASNKRGSIIKGNNLTEWNRF